MTKKDNERNNDTPKNKSLKNFLVYSDGKKNLFEIF